MHVLKDIHWRNDEKADYGNLRYFDIRRNSWNGWCCQRRSGFRPKAG
jgi:hypothetical protein